MSVYCLILESTSPQKTFPLENGENLVGRSRSSQVRLDLSDVSGKHCLVKVSGESVAVENLSANGTRLQGETVEFITLMQVGDVISIGESTNLRLGLMEEDPEKSEILEKQEGASEADQTLLTASLNENDAAVEGSEDAFAETPPQEMDSLEEPPTLAPPPPKHPETQSKPEEEIPTVRPSLNTPGRTDADEDDRPTKPPVQNPSASGSSDDDEYQTVQLQTMRLNQAHLEELRTRERKRGRKLYAILVILGLLAIAGGFFLWPDAPQVEAEIAWPQDASGNYLKEEISGLSKGSGAATYSIGVPGAPGAAREQIGENALRIETRVGVLLDCPLVLIIEETEDRQCYRETLPETVQRWMKEISRDGEGWTFSDPLDPITIGKENGVPFVLVRYDHRQDGSWSGSARIFRHGGTRYVLRVEVPHEFRYRAKNMVNIQYFKLSEEFERSFWSGLADSGREDLSVLQTRLRERFRGDMKREMAWSALERLIIQVCCAAALEGNSQAQAAAEDMLAELRQAQRNFFNEQKLRYIEFRRTPDRDASMRQVVEYCKAVFSSREDLRYSLVRQEKWVR